MADQDENTSKSSSPYQRRTEDQREQNEGDRLRSRVADVEEAHEPVSVAQNRQFSVNPGDAQESANIVQEGRLTEKPSQREDRQDSTPQLEEQSSLPDQLATEQEQRLETETVAPEEKPGTVREAPEGFFSKEEVDQSNIPPLLQEESNGRVTQAGQGQVINFTVPREEETASELETESESGKTRSTRVTRPTLSSSLARRYEAVENRSDAPTNQSPLAWNEQYLNLDFFGSADGSAGKMLRSQFGHEWSDQALSNLTTDFLFQRLNGYPALTWAQKEGFSDEQIALLTSITNDTITNLGYQWWNLPSDNFNLDHLSASDIESDPEYLKRLTAFKEESLNGFSGFQKAMSWYLEWQKEKGASENVPERKLVDLVQKSNSGEIRNQIKTGPLPSSALAGVWAWNNFSNANQTDLGSFVQAPASEYYDFIPVAGGGGEGELYIDDGDVEEEPGEDGEIRATIETQRDVKLKQKTEIQTELEIQQKTTSAETEQVEPPTSAQEEEKIEGEKVKQANRDLKDDLGKKARRLKKRSPRSQNGFQPQKQPQAEQVTGRDQTSNQEPIRRSALPTQRRVPSSREEDENDRKTPLNQARDQIKDQLEQKGREELNKVAKEQIGKIKDKLGRGGQQAGQKATQEAGKQVGQQVAKSGAQATGQGLGGAGSVAGGAGGAGGASVAGGAGAAAGGGMSAGAIILIIILVLLVLLLIALIVMTFYRWKSLEAVRNQARTESNQEIASPITVNLSPITTSKPNPSNSSYDNKISYSLSLTPKDSSFADIEITEIKATQTYKCGKESTACPESYDNSGNFKEAMEAGFGTHTVETNILHGAESNWSRYKDFAVIQNIEVKSLANLGSEAPVASSSDVVTVATASSEEAGESIELAESSPEVTECVAKGFETSLSWWDIPGFLWFITHDLVEALETVWGLPECDELGITVDFSYAGDYGQESQGTVTGGSVDLSNVPRNYTANGAPASDPTIDKICKAFGVFGADVAGEAVAIARAESGLKPAIVGDDEAKGYDATAGLGLFQITKEKSYWEANPAEKASMLTAEGNIAAAVQLYKALGNSFGEGWSGWGGQIGKTYNTRTQVGRGNLLNNADICNLGNGQTGYNPTGNCGQNGRIVNNECVYN